MGILHSGSEFLVTHYVFIYTLFDTTHHKTIESSLQVILYIFFKFEAVLELRIDSN